VHTFIRINAHICISIYIYTIFIKKSATPSLFDSFESKWSIVTISSAMARLTSMVSANWSCILEGM
jgi:hypothetical protein